MRTGRWAGIVLMTFLAPGIVSAAALKADEVSAQANWVVHVDCEAFRATSLGKMVRNELAADGIRDKLKDFATVFGFNPQQDLRDITLYGQGPDHEKAVVLIDGHFNEETLLALVRLNPEHEAIPYGPLTLHRWIRPKNRAARSLDRLRERLGTNNVGRMVYGTLYDGHLITASAGLPAAKQALDILQGSASEASPSRLDLASPVSKGTFFRLAAADVSKAPGLPSKSPVLRQTDAVSLMVGETNDKVFFDLTLTAKSPESAQAIVTIWEGIGALARMAQQDRPLLASFGDSLQLSRSDKTAHIRAEAPADMVLTRLKQRWIQKRLQEDGK